MYKAAAAALKGRNRKPLWGDTSTRAGQRVSHGVFLTLWLYRYMATDSIDKKSNEYVSSRRHPLVIQEKLCESLIFSQWRFTSTRLRLTDTSCARCQHREIKFVFMMLVVRLYELKFQGWQWSFWRPACSLCAHNPSLVKISEESDDWGAFYTR